MIADQNPIRDLVQQIGTCDADSAMTLLEAAATRYPANPHVLFLLAAQYMQAKHTDQAEAAYIAVLQVAPDYSIARFQLGLLQMTSGRPATALTTWGPLDLLENRHPLRLFKRAFELLHQNQIADACTLLREGIGQNVENDPLSRDMQMLLGRLEAAMAEEARHGAPTAAKAASQSIEADEGAHFLLSTYKSLH
ncbi:hypothetical protein PI87_02610 [Ralstonia sp. A12]|uniref:tetratricopeptide repeat protein n=1 Tax=Ralstonia sp. A12 TaxID=1217052 RepID=UPI000573493A|nr:tetratricopeptide repeat protein [Ralstonia sp. A12]KHK58658.1 hypothetical protein PI87_02610 [Ralstonia sp. A12]